MYPLDLQTTPRTEKITSREQSALPALNPRKFLTPKNSLWLFPAPSHITSGMGSLKIRTFLLYFYFSNNAFQVTAHFLLRLIMKKKLQNILERVNEVNARRVCAELKQQCL